jgi:peptidoglycan/xylan/chitin deacetylase (PgdA/CDA1 family)
VEANGKSINNKTGTELGAQQNIMDVVTEAAVVYKSKVVENLAKHNKCNLHVGEYTTLPCANIGKAFKSMNENIVHVSDSGKIYAKKSGKTKVISRDAKGKYYKYKIKVLKKGFIYYNYTIMKGEKLDLRLGFTNKLKHMKWSSNNPSVASVKKYGLVKAKKIGKVTLTGKKNKRRYFLRLTVKKKPKSIIYLTFDDGPSPNCTPKILDILRKYHVKATFFELRPASTDYHITKRVIREGHTLALHGYSHHYEQIYRSKKIYRKNLDDLQKLFFKQFGVWCTVSRFPGGSSNTVSRFNRGIMTKITKKIHDWRYHYFDWNISSGDAGLTTSTKVVYRNVTSCLREGQENVVLMHDAPTKMFTVNALEDIIKYGKKHGFKFRAITAATKEVHHNVNN